MITNIGIGFVTGRRQFQNVLNAYINNWLEHGLLSNKNIRIHLLIAGDLQGEKADLKDFKNVDSDLRQRIYSVALLDDEYTEKEITKLSSSRKVKEQEMRLVFGDGYAKKRNLILYVAMKMRLDNLLFLNDDEYPIASFRSQEGHILWMGQSLTGTHLKYSAESDITCGRQCGYILPFPFLPFNNQLSENDFRIFIKAIGNSLGSWDNAKNNTLQNKGVTYADWNIIKKEILSEVKEVRRLKIVPEANLCFNLRKKKSFPPFFNPPGVKNGNTFMSTCLNDFKILKVPCYTFCDGFGMYKSILNGVLPARFIPADITSEIVVSKFIKAAISRARSKPLLVFIMQTGNYGKIMGRIRSDLALTIPKLCNHFGTDRFEQIYAELDYYDRNVRRHYNLFSETKRVWALITANLK